MASRDVAIILSDDDDEVSVASPASSTSSASPARPSHAPSAHPSPSSASSAASSSHSAGGSKRSATRVNPTTLPPAQPRRGTQRLPIAKPASFEVERKEGGVEDRRRPQPQPQHPSGNSPRGNTPRIPPFPLNASDPPPASLLRSAPSSPVASNQPGGSIVTEMAFVPRPEAVTIAPEYTTAESVGWRAVAYALCEYIDNALTALRKSMEREPTLKPEIKILFVEPTEWFAATRKMYILISDNGCGMDAAAVNSFARMADAPKNRGILRDPNQEANDRINNYVNCTISQWGVGAKTAGFYVGTSIRVITCPGNDRVYEIDLSAKQMEQKYTETGNAFHTKLHERERGCLESCGSHFTSREALDNPHIRRVLEEERRPDCRHFSRFLITTDAPSPFLLGSIRGWFEGADQPRESDGSFMSFPLANVYYRLLHGPYGEGHGALNKKARWTCPTISLQYWNYSHPSPRWVVTDLRDVRGYPQSEYQKHHRGKIFRCEVEFTAPQGDSELPAGDKSVARVEVLYYPKRWEGETHPRLVEAARLEEKRLDEKERARNSRRGAAAAAAAAHDQAVSLEEDEDKDVIDAARKLRRESVGSQFWNGRLIPEDQDRLLYFMELNKPTPELKEALSRIHYNVFFAYPVLTDRVKLHFRQNLVDWINRPDNTSTGWIKTEYTVDNRTGASTKCSRNRSLREQFRHAVKEWVALDENYMFDEADFIQRLSVEEKEAHFTKVRLSSDKWVKQGDLQLINVKGSQPTFIRVLCIRQNIDTTEYLDRRARDMGSQGWVIGYIEPRELESAPRPSANAPAIFTNPLSVQPLLRGDRIRTQPDIDLKLAPSRLRMFPLRLVDKEVSDAELARQYQVVARKAAETFPTRLALYAVPMPWHEVKHGAELQFRVKECFPGSSVVALTAQLDEDGLPLPVGGERVTQCTYKVTDARSRQRLARAQAEAKDNELDSQSGAARSSNPRAGQLARRQRIPRKAQREQSEEKYEAEAKHSEPEPRYSSSGRAIRRPQDLMAAVSRDEGSGKRRAEEAGGGQRKRKKPDSSDENGTGPPSMGSGEEEQVIAADDMVAVPPSHMLRTLVEHGQYEGDVCSVQDAALLLRDELDRANTRVNGFVHKRFHEIGLHQVEYTPVRKTVDGDREHVLPICVNVRVFPGAPVSAQLATPQPTSLRLGQRLSGVRLLLEDKWHNPITPSAMRAWKGADLCTVRLSCEEYSQLRVSADECKLLPHESKDQYQIVGLRIEPSEQKGDDELMLDFGGADKALLLTCRIELTVPAHSDEDAEVEETTLVVRQKVRLLPGEPQNLQEDFPTELTSTNDDSFPDFSLQFIDAFGKPAVLTDDNEVPQVSIWCDDQRVEGWVAGKIAAQPMLSNGSFSSAALLLPPFFIHPHVLANIMTTNREREMQQGVPAPDEQPPGEHTFTVHLQVKAGDEEKLHKQCHVTVLARFGPTFLLLTQSTQQDDLPQIDQLLEVRAKPFEDVTLLVQGVDDAGYLLPLDSDSHPDLPECGWRSNRPLAIRKAMYVTVSGLVDLAGGPYQCGFNELDESGLVPFLKMPKQVERRRLECEVRVEFDEARLPAGGTAGMTDEETKLFEEELRFVRTRLPLTCPFVVLVQQLKPTKWSATVPPSLPCAKPWGTTVQLFAVDKHGNRVSVPRMWKPPRIAVVADVERVEDCVSRDEEPGQASTGVADFAMQVEAQQPVQRAATTDDCYQRVILENAEPVGVAEAAEEDDVYVDEWSHFVCENARVIMQAGAAALMVYDDGNDEQSLRPSGPIHFTVEPGRPTSVRVWLQDRSTGELMRLHNPKPSRPPQSSSDIAMIGERKQGDAAESTGSTPGRLILPVRMKFDQLVLRWLDRGKNVVIPNTHCRTHLTLRIDNGAIFELPDGRGLHSGQTHAFHVTALPELRDLQSVFPSFVCIYSAGADELQRRAVEMKDEESVAYYRDKRMRLRVEVAAEAATQAARTLASIEFGLCMLPYSVKGLNCKAVFKPAVAHHGQGYLELYRALLSPSVISNLKSEELDGNVMVMAGEQAPDLEVRLPQQENRSSLRYTLPQPDPSSLSVEWAYEGQKCLLRYHPAVAADEDGLYIFRPVVEERSEGEQEVVAQGEGVAAVGRFGKLDKAGKWSYCVTYTEKRPRLADVLTNRVQTNSADEEVLPSVPHTLHVQRSDESSATMPIVGNSESGNRIIGRDIRLFIVDEYGSAVHLPLMSDALRQAVLGTTCTVEPVVNNAGSGMQHCHLPQIRVEQAVLNNQLHCVVLPSVTVIDSRDGLDADSGPYKLVFSLPAPFSAQFQCSLRFFFSNEKQLLEERRVEEQRRSARRQQLTALLAQAQAEVAASTAGLAHTGQAVTSLDNWRRNIAKDEDSVLAALRGLMQQASSQPVLCVDVGALERQLSAWRAVGTSPSSSLPHPFLKLDQQLLAAINSLGGRLLNMPAVLYGSQSTNHQLILKAPNNTPLERGPDGFYGMLASFCTVQDASLCQLLSWHFRKLGVYLVQSTHCNAKQVIDANAARLSFPLLTVMYVEEQSRQRPPPPHERLPAALRQTVNGQPRYVYDLLHFPEPDPQLRLLHQQAIQRVVGSTMVINSMDDAVQYRRLLQHHNIATPDLLALRELKVLFHDNTEQLGTRAAAPPLHTIVPRLGVQLVKLQRLIGDVEAARTKAATVSRDTAELRQQWVANGWVDKEARQRHALAAAQHRRQQLESELKTLAEQAGQAAVVAPPDNVLLTSGAGTNRHRRRQAG